VISPTQGSLPNNTQHSQEKEVHAHGGIRTCNPSKRAAAEPRLGPRGHCVQLNFKCYLDKFSASYTQFDTKTKTVTKLLAKMPTYFMLKQVVPLLLMRTSPKTFCISGGPAPFLAWHVWSPWRSFLPVGFCFKAENTWNYSETTRTIQTRTEAVGHFAYKNSTSQYQRQEFWSMKIKFLISRLSRVTWNSGLGMKAKNLY
jgi:hypothetical protein